ncbi:MAG: hypothetical protein ACE5FC_06615 [Myxococcota bacterium]
MRHPRLALALALFLIHPLWRAVPAAAAGPSVAIDLASVSTSNGTLRRVYGHTGSGNRGVPVAGGFDCDGDGLPDYAMASMQASPLGRSLAGEVYLVFGDGTIGGALDTAVMQAAILEIIGDGVREMAGSELWMDDVTGDDLGDLLIARQNFSPPGRIGAGALTILVGGSSLQSLASSMTVVDLRTVPPQTAMTTFWGDASLHRLGIWMRTGDVTGDGIADIVVGADQTSTGPEPHRGAAWVIRGGAHLAATQTIDLADFGTPAFDLTALAGHVGRIDPPSGSSHYHFGATCQIADLDGNGTAEVLVAAALNRAGASVEAFGAPAGSAHGTGGSPDGTLYIAWDDNFTGNPWASGFSFDISSPPGSRTIIDGGARNVSFGEEILGGLDYDADGAPDLFVGDIVGDWTADQSRINSGSGHVIYGAAQVKNQVFTLDTPPGGLAITTFLGGAIGDIAADTAMHGDFDGDGIDDLAFSSPHAAPLGRPEAGIIHIFHGKNAQWPSLIDLKTGMLPAASAVRITEIYGANGTFGLDSGDVLSYSAAAGDIDGDGRADIITNEMQGNGVLPAAQDVGNLIVVSGALILQNTVPALPAAGVVLFALLAIAGLWSRRQ